LGAGSLLVEHPDLVTYRMGLKRNFPALIDFDSLRPPDTKAAHAAESLLASHFSSRDKNRLTCRKVDRPH
jgi:hypothetical protein